MSSRETQHGLPLTNITRVPKIQGMEEDEASVTNGKGNDDKETEEQVRWAMRIPRYARPLFG